MAYRPESIRFAHCARMRGIPFHVSGKRTSVDES